MSLLAKNPLSLLCALAEDMPRSRTVIEAEDRRLIDRRLCRCQRPCRWAQSGAQNICYLEPSLPTSGLTKTSAALTCS